MNKVFVFNSSPIIALTNANLEAVIELTLNDFIIPELVAKEVSNKACKRFSDKDFLSVKI